MLFLDKKIELNPTEKSIYHYIYANLNNVVYMRIKDLADSTHVSTTTILRFCRKFDCQGFSDFKIRLQYYLHDMKNNNMLIQNYDETVYFDFLMKSMSKEFKTKINNAAQIISNSELVFFSGNGTSAILADYATSLFAIFHPFSFVIKDPSNYPVYTLPKKFEGKICLVVFSVSGENAEVLEIMERFRVHDVKIISITNSSLSRISHLSDLNLSYYINEEKYQDSNITSQLPVISIIENLARLTFSKQNSI